MLALIITQATRSGSEAVARVGPTRACAWLAWCVAWWSACRCAGRIAMGSVDDIWASLKAKTAPSQHARRARELLRNANGESTSSRVTTGRAERAYDLPVAPHADRRGETSSSRASTPPSETAPSAPAVPDFPDVDAIRQHVARDVNALADAQAPPSSRLRALRRVADVIDAASPSLLAETAVEVFAKPLLRRFEDPSEQCRETATDAFASLARRSDAVLELLPYAIPVLRDRLGPADEDSRDPREPSEEVRARTHALLRALLDSAETGVAAYASDAVEILVYTVEDAHADVALESCACLETLVTHLGRRLAPVSKRLAWSFAPNLTHRRARVRSATLRAMRGLMHCGAHETMLDLAAFRHPNLVPVKAFYGEDRKVNYFGKLATDASPQVRREFIATLGDWMTTLVERTDHEPRLLPYVLSALVDESDDVRRDATALMDRLGEQYEREHEKELKSTMTYMPEHFGEDVYGEGEDALRLPPPFERRPRLGSRVLVKNNFAGLVNPVVAEMSSWQLELRAKAAALLRTNMVFLEENATQHTQSLCSAFVAASRDDVVSRDVFECCRLMGRFVRPKEWLETLLRRVTPENDAPTRAGAIRTLAACLAGAARDALRGEDAARDATFETLDALETSGAAHSADTSVRVATCAFVETCAREKPGTWRDLAARLASLALRAGASHGSADDAATEASRVALDAVASAIGASSSSEAVGALRGDILAPLRALPPKGWRAADAAALAAAAEAPGAVDAEDAATLARLCALAAERPAASACRARLLAFPFVARLSAPMTDGDVALLLGAALRAVIAEPRETHARPALAAAEAALRPTASSAAAARASARLVVDVVARVVAMGETPAPVRADAVALVRALTDRDGGDAASRPVVVAVAADALEMRLDDADDATRRAAAAAMASLARVSPFAAYRCVAATTKPHLLASDMRFAAIETLRSAHGAHPAATRAAAERSGSKDVVDAADEAGATGEWTPEDVDAVDAARAEAEAEKEATRVRARGAEDVARVESEAEAEAAAAASATARLAAVGIDARARVGRETGTGTISKPAGEDSAADEDDAELFDLD